MACCPCPHGILSVSAALLAIALVVGGCRAQVPPAAEPAAGSPWISCQNWPEACQGCAQPMPRGDIGIMVHVMRTVIDPDFRRNHPNEPPWKLTRDKDEVLKYWTVPAIEQLFGANGGVNEIWKQAEKSPDTREPAQIRFSLRRVQKCTYLPDLLRLDGRLRDSMVVPESYVPWAGRMFERINRSFAVKYPGVVHVLIWWSITEEDAQNTGKLFRTYGYSRSAAYGGPAVWTDGFGCRATVDGPPTLDYDCASKVLAHELGHALGLQHVDDCGNLMYYIQPSTGIAL